MLTQSRRLDTSTRFLGTCLATACCARQRHCNKEQQRLTQIRMEGMSVNTLLSLLNALPLLLIWTAVRGYSILVTFGADRNGHSALRLAAVPLLFGTSSLVDSVSACYGYVILPICLTDTFSDYQADHRGRVLLFSPTVGFANNCFPKSVASHQCIKCNLCLRFSSQHF